MSITNVDRIGGFVVGNEANYNASAFGKSIFFAPDTKQLIVDGVKYIPKKLSELTDDVLSPKLGETNGIATLDSSGKVPSTQLPSYVDDFEVGNSALFNNDVQIDGSLNCTSDAHVDGNLTTLGVLKVGGATLSWDEANQCLMVDKGIASDSFVSAGGVEESSTIAELQLRIAQLEAQLTSLTNK